MEEDQGPRGETYEAEHVHAVYEQIASHFSLTRYKPWPIVLTFLSRLPPSSIGLDIGCGNGKNLFAFPSSFGHFILGSDRSTNLVRLASDHLHQRQRHGGAAVVVADALALPHPAGRFDFAISIAVLHHFSTRQRRVEGVRAVLEVLRPRRGAADAVKAAGEAGAGDGGRALFTVWALEQQGSRRGWDEGCEQDVMVPWVMRGGGGGRKKGGKGEGKGDQRVDGSAEEREESGEKEEETSAEEQDRTFHRYYHLYKNGELEHDIAEAGGVVLNSGYEKDNWWAVAARLAT